MTSARTEVGADAAALAPLQSFLLGFWQDADLPAADRFPFELALEEVFMNVVMHGSQGRSDVRVAVELHRRSDGVELTIVDNGRPFDPLQAPIPDTDAPIEDRAIGGLGVYLIRTLMDTVTYRRDGESNVLSMVKSIH